MISIPTTVTADTKTQNQGYHDNILYSDNYRLKTGACRYLSFATNPVLSYCVGKIHFLYNLIF